VGPFNRFTPGHGYPLGVVFESEVSLAHELADLADSIALPRFRADDLHVQAKPDHTFVTDADRAVEEALRTQLATARPGDDVVGEELGDDDVTTTSSRRWILDPIDGTHNYLRGVPIFGTLIALEEGEELVLGMASAPALGHRWWAARGGGAFADGRPIHVSAVGGLEDAHLSYDSVRGFEERGLGERFLSLAGRVWRTRGFGDFWQHMLVAEGAVDVVIEPLVDLWDLAAVKVIVEEAGGRLTDFDGVPRADGGNAISSNGLLHDDVVAALRG
jgi:histidinol-phosphatase